MHSDLGVPSRGALGWPQRHQLLAFVLLAYALSWWAWVWYRADPGNVDAPILPVGPLLAVLILLPLIGGWPALKDLFRRLVHWRVGWAWYALVLLAPPTITLAAYALNRLMGAEVVAGYEAPDLGRLVFVFVFIFLWIGLGEEPGWRGFALPRLLRTHDALTAALILGAIHMVWHLPLYGVEYGPSNVLPWGISVFCYSIVIAWIYQHTGGSLLIPMLMHASNNTVASAVWRMFDGADEIRLWWVWVALWIAFAGLVVLLTGRDLRRG